MSYFKWLVIGRNHGRPVLVVKYEDLKSDSLTQVKRMLEFLRVPYSDKELEKRLRGDFKSFQRKHTNSNFEYYTPEQKQFVKSMMLEALKYLYIYNNGTTYGIQDYME